MPKKVSFHVIQQLIFQVGAGDHFGFEPLEKNAGIFGRDMVAKFFSKGSIEAKSMVKPY